MLHSAVNEDLKRDSKKRSEAAANRREQEGSDTLQPNRRNNANDIYGGGLDGAVNQSAAANKKDRLAWLKGQPRETPIEHQAVAVTASVVGFAGSLACTALDKVGYHDAAADTVNKVRSKVGALADGNKYVKDAHSFAKQLWPYVIAERFVSHVDEEVRGRIGRKKSLQQKGSVVAAGTVAAPTSTKMGDDPTTMFSFKEIYSWEM